MTSSSLPATLSPPPPGLPSDDLHHRRSERKKVRQVQDFLIYQKTIGAGSMGKVKLAECLSDRHHSQYAVKIMPKLDLTAIPTTKPKDPKDAPEQREMRTVREMAIMNLLRHPNICRLERWLVQGDSYYMFLEYIKGGQLLDYIIANGRLREKQARSFARQIVSALDYCHRNSIVHRDLKIENIMINHTEDTIKIIDFGLSNMYSPLGQLNTFCGSLYFAAPELLQARNYIGPEVDVWSFGVVLYVLVCGCVPFDDASLPALHQKIKAGKVDYPHYLSKECVDLLSRILVVDPSRRETLSFIRHHPWMNKGFDDPVPSNLPQRRPLDTIDMDVVRDMDGFGFGTPDEIRQKLERIIRTPEYLEAAAKAEKSQQRTEQISRGHTRHGLWRRSTSSGGRRTSQLTTDDPQTLPALYEPLVSVYYLAKEAKERRAQEAIGKEDESAISGANLSRSASTTISRPKTESQLQRRRTERVPNYRADTSSIKDDSTLAEPSTPLRSSTNLLQRSKSVARLLGSLFPNLHATIQINNPADDIDTDSTPVSPSPLKRSFSLLRTRSSSDRRSSTTRRQAPQPDHEPFIEEDLQGILKTIHAPLNNSVDDTSSTQPGRPTSSLVADASSSRRTSAPAPTLPSSSPSHSDVYSTPLPSATLSTPLHAVPIIPITKDAHPKSQFQFNRRRLFCVSPQQMLISLQELLHDQDVYCQPAAEGQPFTLQCESYSPKLTGRDDNDHSSFTLTIYQARWMGGRLGIKIIDTSHAHRSKSHSQTIYRNILGELDKRIQAIRTST